MTSMTERQKVEATQELYHGLAVAQAAVDAQLLPAPHAEDGSQTIAHPDTLYCTICGDPIPEGRATRPTATCSEKCKNRLDTIRINQRRARKCPHCLHPSTPEERDEYRVWRAERGDRKTAVFIPRDRTVTPKNDLRDALRSATGHLERLEGLLAYLEAAEPVAGLLEAFPKGFQSRSAIQKRLERVRSRVRDFQQLVDKAPESSKLSA